MSGDQRGDESEVGPSHRGEQLAFDLVVARADRAAFDAAEAWDEVSDAWETVVAKTEEFDIAGLLQRNFPDTTWRITFNGGERGTVISRLAA